MRHKRTIKSVEEFIKNIAELREEWFPDEELLPWCRGQERAEWSLTPRLYRTEVGNVKQILNTESEIREEFASRSPNFVEHSTVSDADIRDWDSYFLMQHFGAPTRLLDWTESALVALYFAVRSNAGNFNAAVWVLDPWWLNKRSAGKAEVVPPSDPGTRKKDRGRYRPWLPARFPKNVDVKKFPELPAAIYPTHTNRRISSQRSCFTIHGKTRNSFENLAKTAPLVKMEIPGWEVLQIRRTLKACGMDEMTVFPDLEALGRVVTSDWITQQYLPPHHGVLTRIGASKLHGVGVFALRPIPEGRRLFGPDNIGMVWVQSSELKGLPTAVAKLYKDFGVLKEGRFGVPPNFNQLTPAWYLNESKESPNVRVDEHFDFFAARPIRKDEELTIDYSVYSEDPYAVNRTKDARKPKQAVRADK